MGFRHRNHLCSNRSGLTLLAAFTTSIWARAYRSALCTHDAICKHHGRHTGETRHDQPRHCTNCCLERGYSFTLNKTLILTREHWQLMQQHVDEHAPLEA